MESKGRVLIVDRDRSRLRSYSDGLSRAGFDVVGALEASDALRHMENEQFDVFISDVNVPEMSGLKLLRRIRERFRNLQLILILDRPDNKIAVQAAELGVLQALFKPIELETLERTATLGVRLHRERADSVVFKTRNPLHSKPASFTATEAKNEFGRVLEKAMQGGLVFITKHDAPKAVMLSIDGFNALSAEFDSLLARMQSPAARNAMDAAFHASPTELGRAALTAARKRG
jgi:antitoxin Phd